MRTTATYSRDFARRERASLRFVEEIPLASYELRLRWDRSGNLARPSDRARYPGAERVVISLVEERYRIEGFDREDAVEDLYLTFVLRDGSWKVAEDTDVDDLTLFSSRSLWDFGPIETRRSEHFMMLSHPCASSSPCPATAHDYLGLAEQALRQVRPYWPRRWHDRIPILVPDDEDELARMIQSTFDLDDFVAFAYSTVDAGVGRKEGVDYTGHRILLNPAGFEGRSESSVLQIMAHELLHVATRTSTGPFVPAFVDEGIADYVGYGGSRAGLAFFDSEVAQGLFSGALPEDYEFTVGSGTDIYRSYQESQAAVAFFIERWGLKRFVRFYVDLGRKDFVAGTARLQLDRSLRRTIGLGIREFESAWADSIASR
jgi:hypothetical protein